MSTSTTWARFWCGYRCHDYPQMSTTSLHPFWSRNLDRCQDAPQVLSYGRPPQTRPRCRVDKVRRRLSHFLPSGSSNCRTGPAVQPVGSLFVSCRPNGPTYRRPGVLCHNRKSYNGPQRVTRSFISGERVRGGWGLNRSRGLPSGILFEKRGSLPRFYTL